MVILTYHSIKNPTAFETHIRYLKSHGYTMISLSSFIEHVREETVPDDRHVLITFDDGDCSLFENAMPLLHGLSVPAVVFVITSLVGTDAPYWWDEIRHYSVDRRAMAKARTIPNADRLLMLAQLREGKPQLKGCQLTWDQLHEMERNGFAIANHSHTHPMFDQLSRDEIRDEMARSMKALADRGFGHGDIFAYPNGNASDVAELALKESGVSLAFLFDHHLCNGKVNPLRISRLSVNDTTPLWKFKLMLSGIHSHLAPISRRLYRLAYEW